MCVLKEEIANVASSTIQITVDGTAVRERLLSRSAISKIWVEELF